MEYGHDALSEMLIDFRIIRDVTGLGKFTNQSDIEQIDDLEAAIVDLKRERNAVPSDNDFEGAHTVRVYNLLAKAPAVAELIEHSAVLEVCDVILLDQRGTGKSSPSLRWRWEGELPLRFFADAEFAMQHTLAMSRQARAGLLEKGIDLAGYHPKSFDDLGKCIQ